MDYSRLRQKSRNNIRQVETQQKNILNKFTQALDNPDLNNTRYLASTCFLENRAMNE